MGPAHVSALTTSANTVSDTICDANSVHNTIYDANSVCDANKRSIL